MNLEEMQVLVHGLEPDDTDGVLMISDELESMGYPNVGTFRAATLKLQEAQTIGMEKSGTYDGVFWAIRRRVIRLLTEAEHWLLRQKYGVPWVGRWED